MGTSTKSEAARLVLFGSVCIAGALIAGASPLSSGESAATAGTPTTNATAATTGPETFATPEQAAAAMVEAAEKFDVTARQRAGLQGGR
jgi:hypothetical protein